MSPRQRVERGALGLVAKVSGAVFVVLVVVSATGTARAGSWLVAGLWGSGLLALLCGFAAARVEDDATDDPEYLASLATGLRAEWHRDSRTP